jgi:membrane protein required for colicin V production
MGSTDSLTLLDGIVLVILLIGITRGIFIGLVRESFSMAALGAAILAARYGTEGFSAALEELSRGAIGPALAPWLAGAILGIGTIVIMTLIGRAVQRGVRAAGLTWLDRAGGGALGAAEGALVSLLVVFAATFIVGRQHPVVDGSRSLALYDAARSYLEEKADDLPNVAAPNDWL